MFFNLAENELKFMDSRELAALSGLPRNVIRAAAKNGEMRYTTTSSARNAKLRINVADFERWLAQKVQGKQPSLTVNAPASAPAACDALSSTQAQQS